MDEEKEKYKNEQAGQYIQMDDQELDQKDRRENSWRYDWALG